MPLRVAARVAVGDELQDRAVAPLGECQPRGQRGPTLLLVVERRDLREVERGLTGAPAVGGGEGEPALEAVAEPGQRGLRVAARVEPARRLLCTVGEERVEGVLE